MLAKEFANMSLCNLAKFIHNKWPQASNNKDRDLYVAIVDDYIQAFLEVVVYFQFVKGGISVEHLRKEELKLKCAQRHAKHTSNPIVVEKISFACLAKRNFVLAIFTLRWP